MLCASEQTLTMTCQRLALAARRILSPLEFPSCFLALPVEKAPLVFDAAAFILNESKTKCEDPCKEVGDGQRK